MEFIYLMQFLHACKVERPMFHCCYQCSIHYCGARHHLRPPHNFDLLHTRIRCCKKSSISRL